MEVRWPIRDGDEGGRGKDEWRLETGANSEDQGCHGLPPEQQNVTAVSIRHCAATTIPHNCCPNCYAEQSPKDNVHSFATGKSKRSPNLKPSSTSLLLISSGLDLITTSLFLILPGPAKASNFFVRVQLTSLLDLTWARFDLINCCFLNTHLDINTLLFYEQWQNWSFCGWIFLLKGCNCYKKTIEELVSQTKY